MERATRVIAVVNEKGGVGKTTTVVNLAAALTEWDQKVLVVDMDPQFNATRWMGMDAPEGALTTYDILTAKRAPNPEEAVVETPWPGLYLIPSHVDLAGAEIELVNKIARESRLRRIEPLKGQYDFILIDAPPSLSLITINIFAFANEVLIPCQTQPHAYTALDDLLDTLELVREEINPDLTLTGVVPTFCNTRTRVGREVLDKLEKDERFQDKVFDPGIRTNATIAESALNKKPVIFFKQSSYGAMDYRRLAEQILNNGHPAN